MQLKTAVKQILIKNALKLKNNGNCNIFDDDAMCNIFDLKWNKNLQNDQFNNESDENDPEILQRLQLINNLNPSLQTAKENILYYILGYIITKVVKQLDCHFCKLSILKQTSDHNYYSSNYAKFVNLRNNGRLVSGSESTFKIISETEKCLLILTDNLTDLNKSNLKKEKLYICVAIN